MSGLIPSTRRKETPITYINNYIWNYTYRESVNWKTKLREKICLYHKWLRFPSQGVITICRLKGRRGVTEAKERLQLEQLNARRRNSAWNFSLKSCQEKDPSYDDIIIQPKTTVQTRLQWRNEPCSTSTTSFLPCTIGDLKIWPTDDYYNRKTLLDGYKDPRNPYAQLMRRYHKLLTPR